MTIDQGFSTVLSAVIAGVFATLGSFLGWRLNSKKRIEEQKKIIAHELFSEKQRSRANEACENLKAFRELEDIYIDTIVELREAAKHEKFNTKDGVQREARSKLKKKKGLSITYHPHDYEDMKVYFADKIANE